VVAENNKPYSHQTQRTTYLHSEISPRLSVGVGNPAARNKKTSSMLVFMVVHIREHDIYSSWPFNIAQNEPGSINHRHKKADTIADIGYF